MRYFVMEIIENSDHIYEEDLGSVKIPDEVIAVCAINAATRTKGVAGLSGGLSDSITENILGKEPLAKGTKVTQTSGGITIDIFIKVNYGVKIPSVAWDLQRNVKKEVETMTDKAVMAVNVHVQGVEREQLND
jgi:uncharacterized alkaline shock family protein YloU